MAKPKSRYNRRQDLRESLIKAWIERKAEEQRNAGSNDPAERENDEKADRGTST